MVFFTIGELTASDTAKRKGIQNFPDALATAHLHELVDTLLDPLRDAWGGPIIVTSGYRCKELNKAVGGVSNSAHLAGFAADLFPQNGQFEKFVDFTTRWLKSTGKPFDQCLIERSGKSAWLHLAVRNLQGEQRAQIKVLNV